MEHPPRKISIIFHTRTVKSNGLVAWSPKRMELFTTPHQAIYAQDWLEQLAIHEFRHVVQMDKIQQELPAILPIIFGEQAAAAVVGAYLPFWFIEGDAVVTETAFSNSGRGRLASFLMENKAQVIEKGLYSFNKASLGSFADFVPNRYKFGYWMVGGIRQQYGTEIWAQVMDEVAERPFSINPVNRVLKSKTGFKQRQLYEHLFENYQKKWRAELDSLSLTSVKNITTRQKNFTNYTQPFALNDSTWIALKESRTDLTRIVKITGNTEAVIATPGSIFQESFSGEKNMLIWSERRPDVRWTHADRSVVVVYNMATKAKQEFRFDDKVFAPVISPKQVRFAAVEVDQTNHYFLSVFDMASGKRLQQFSLPQNEFVLTPCWDDTGTNIFYVSLSSSGKALSSIRLTDGQSTKLADDSFHEIRNPHFSNGVVYFTGSFTGIDNIYALHLQDHRIEQLSSVPFGADYPTVVNGDLLFSNYTSDGYQLSLLSQSDMLNKPFNKIYLKKYELAELLAKQEGQVLNFKEVNKNNYSTKAYHKLEHVFNFHSWAPAYIDVNNYDLQPGVSLFSQNKLGTAETHLGYKYDLEEEAGKYIAGFKYSGFFPVLDTEVTYGKRNSKYWLITNTEDQDGNVVAIDTTLQQFSWNEFSFDGSVYVPLQFSQGKFSQYIYPQIEYSYEKLSHTSSTPHQFYSGYYHSLTYLLYLQNVMAQSELDIMPRWAQTLKLTFRDGLKSGSDIGTLSAFESNLYFPGFAKNHSFKFYNGYQSRKSGSSFAFANIIRFPRGYHSFQNNEMYTFAADYAMPLCYPDFSLGRFIYLKRVRASVFFDYSHATGNIYSADNEIAGTFSSNMKSVGVELIGDGHFLRLITPVTVGARGAYLPDTQSFYFQMLFSVNFDSL